MSPNVMDRASSLTAAVRMDVVMAVCVVLGAVLIPRLLSAVTAAYAEVRGRRARRAAKSVMADFAAGNFEAVAKEAPGAEPCATTLAYEVTALCELGRPREIVPRLNASLEVTPVLRSPAALQEVLECLAQDLEFGCDRPVDGALLQQVVARFAAFDVALDDSAQDVLVDALSALGEADRVEAVILARPAAAARGYARLAAAALAREDLAEAEQAVDALNRHGLFVPAHIATSLLRRVSSARGPRAALEMVESERVALSAEGLASVLTSCAAAGDSGCLRDAVALAREQQVPMLLGAYEALVRGWAAAGPDGEEEALRYFDEMAGRGFELTARGCASFIEACGSYLPVARKIFDAARAQGAATSEVYCAMLQVLRRGAALAEAAAWLPELEAQGLLGIDVLPGLVEACLEAGGAAGVGLARDALRAAGSTDPQLHDRVLRYCACDWRAHKPAALALLQEAEERKVKLYPESYSAVQEALLKAGDRGAAAAMLRHAADQGRADPGCFHTLIAQSTWPELNAEQDPSLSVETFRFLEAGPPALQSEPQVLADMRRAGLLPTTRTFALLVGKAVAAEDRAAAFELVGMAADEVGLDGVLKPLLASASGGELERILAIAERDPESLPQVAPELLAACLRAKAPQRIADGVRLLRESGGRLQDPDAAALVAATSRPEQVLALTTLLEGEGYPRARAAAAEKLVGAGRLDEAAAIAAAAEDGSVSGALVSALLLKGERARALAVHDDAAGIPPAPRAALLAALAQGGDVDAATRVFRAATEAGVTLPTLSYEVLALAHCVAGDLGPAQELITAMEARGAPRSKRILAALLDVAARKGDLAVAEGALADLERAGASVTANTLASLVRLAGKLGDLPRADAWIADLPKKHGFALTPQVNSALVRACAQCGDLHRARALLAAQPAAGDAPAVTAVALASLKQGDVQGAAEVAARSLDANQPLDPSLVTSLRDAASKGVPSALLERLPGGGAAAPAWKPGRPAQAWRANVIH